MKKDLTMMSESELLNLLNEWRGAGAYSITGDIIRELRHRRQNEQRKKQKFCRSRTKSK